jgi:hypothetical protein
MKMTCYIKVYTSTLIKHVKMDRQYRRVILKKSEDKNFLIQLRGGKTETNCFIKFRTSMSIINSRLWEQYKVINKKTNQECYLIFCFIETFVYFESYQNYTWYTQSIYWLPIHSVSKLTFWLKCFFLFNGQTYIFYHLFWDDYCLQLQWTLRKSKSCFQG